MGLLIVGKTTCAICGDVIETGADATTLPYVHPSAPKDIRSLALQCVHRSCWEKWDLAEAYTDFACRLLDEFPPRSGPSIIRRCNCTFLYQIGIADGYEIKDLNLLVEFPLYKGETKELINFLLLTLRDHRDSKYEGLHNVWISSFHEPGKAEIYKYDKQGVELYKKFAIPDEESDCWIELLLFVLNRNGSNLLCKSPPGVPPGCE